MDVAGVTRGRCYVADAFVFKPPPSCRSFVFATSPSSLHITRSLHSPFIKVSLSSSLRRIVPAPLGTPSQLYGGKEDSDEKNASQEQEDDLENCYYEQQEKVELSDGKTGDGKEPRPSDATKFQLLGNKEKKQLRACAHQLGKDLVVQNVGKWGISSTVITSLSDALEANELIKVKVLDNCPDELAETIQKLTDSMEAQVISKIGRTVLLYRPSLSKLTAAQKKSQTTVIKRPHRYTSKKRPSPKLTSSKSIGSPFSYHPTNNTALR